VITTSSRPARRPALQVVQLPNCYALTIDNLNSLK
jgi:hypothetical protein